MKSYIQDPEGNLVSNQPRPPSFVAYARWEGPEKTPRELLYPQSEPIQPEWGSFGYYSRRTHGYNDQVKHQVLALEIVDITNGTVEAQYDGAILITEEGVEAPLLIPPELAPWVKIFADAGAAHAYVAQSNAMLWGLQKDWIRRLEELAAAASKEIGDVLLRVAMIPPGGPNAVSEMSDAAKPSTGPDLSGATPS